MALGMGIIVVARVINDQWKAFLELIAGQI